MSFDRTHRTDGPNKRFPSTPVFGLAAVALLGSWPALNGSRPSPDPGVETAVNCRAVNTRAIDAIRTTLRSAYSAASADASQNGSTGQYAVAATNSRDLIKRGSRRRRIGP
jgi:hypothetical protein